MPRNQISRFFFINNGQNSSHFTDQFDEQNSHLMEEQKDESNPDGGPEDRNMESWIDIKQETDRITNEQITQLIEESLFGDAYRLFEQRQLNSRLEEFSIDVQSNADEYDIKPILFRDPEESLMKREKSQHLTFGQKLYVYRSYKAGEGMGDI